MSMSIVAKKYFELECNRRTLATLGLYEELRKTYKSNLRIPDFNSPKFWDNKFSSLIEKSLKNPMELDRNNSAVKWFIQCIVNTKRPILSLNIGCGDGNFEKLLSLESKYKGWFKHTGIDSAKEIIRLNSVKYPEFHFLKRNILTQSFPGKKYNVISMFEVLEHISPRSTMLVLNKIYKSLVPSGYLLISVPMNEGLETMFPDNPNGHMRCYSIDLIISELELSGFKILKDKVFFAFHRHYWIKTLIATRIITRFWQPNNILILAQKKQ